MEKIRKWLIDRVVASPVAAQAIPVVVGYGLGLLGVPQPVADAALALVRAIFGS